MRKRSWFLVGGGVALVLGCGGGGHHGNAARTACAKNLLRLNTSLSVYAGDWDDTLPGTDWNAALTPYLANVQTGIAAVLRCPSVPAGGGVGYAYNVALVHTPLNSVADRDATPAFFDTVDLGANVVAAYPPAPSGRHGGDCVAYLSGRVVPSVDGDKPTPATVRENCLNNLKKIGVAGALYASDNDDRMPTANWMDSYAPYANVADTFRCPAVATGKYGYAFDPALLGVNATTLDNPATTATAFDSSLLTHNALSAFGQNRPRRHGGDNAAYADGHAAEVP